MLCNVTTPLSHISQVSWAKQFSAQHRCIWVKTQFLAVFLAVT